MLIILHHLLFCISGICIVLLVDYINLYQISNIKLGIPSFANYFGYFLAFPVLFMKIKNNTDEYYDNFHWLFIPIFITDIIASTLCFLSMTYAGGQLFTVAYASIIIWTAILKMVIIKQKLNIIGWISIIVIVLGVGLSGISSKDYGSSVEWGIVLGLLGAFVYSIQYTMSEIVMTKYNVLPFTISAFNGLCGLVLTTIYFLIYTIPNFNETIDNPKYLSLSMSGLILSTFIHNITFFYISKNPKYNVDFDDNIIRKKSIFYGSVIIGINKAFQTVLTFIFNDIAFCNVDSIECMNYSKIISIVFVSIGICLYSMSEIIMNKIRYIKDIDISRIKLLN